MGADISRIRFDPLKNFAGVRLNQGAVLLDADFNELDAIVDRRIRAAVTDIVGPSAVPASTPDAFLITVAAGKMDIGAGRIYVHGLLAENPGNPANTRFDPVMAEPAYAGAVSYDAQPYLPDAPALPQNGLQLVYLDVWNREVTHVEQPDLVEVAVGVETSARFQTVWQVRLFQPDTSNVTCATPDTDMPDWAAFIAPSSGRLTTGTFAVPPAEDPCELPPTGGYRGLENQTYRVEIHDGGLPGAGATFKWSRHNASVVSGVEAIESAVSLTLQTLGRDDVLRFNSGDWVEILDDRRELSQLGGEIRRITAIDETARRITFAEPLPASMMPPLPQTFPDSTFPRENCWRVRRWDQHTVLSAAANGTTSVFQDVDADGSGVVRVPADAATLLLLEHGITVSFSAGKNGFRPGDYWVFVARTADASVELLESAPPQGPHHHYTRLATLDAATGAVTDCRTRWPSATGGGDHCACTVCVTPTSHNNGTLTIQKAVDEISATGGTVCLDVGDYQLRGLVTIASAHSVRLIGKGVGSKLLALTGSGAVVIDKNSQDIVLDSFSIVCSGPMTVPQEAVRVNSSGNIRIQHLRIDVAGDQQWAAIGLAHDVSTLTVRGNTLVTPTGIRSGTSSGGGLTTLAGLRIEDNDFDCGTAAISFEAGTQHELVNRICGNRVNGCKEAGFLLTGTTAPGFGLEVQGNVFSVQGHGIVASVGGLRVLDNDILRQPEDPVNPQSGISVGPLGNDPFTDCQILGNRIQGFHRGILVVPPLRALMIKQNQIANVGVGLELSSTDVFGWLSIENNQFNAITGPAILAKGGRDARFVACGNQIHTRSSEPAVVLDFELGDGIFTQNVCYRDGGGNAPDVQLTSATLIVSNNRVVGGDISLDLHVKPKRYTVLGNICHGKIAVDPPALAAQWAPLNFEAVP